RSATAYAHRADAYWGKDEFDRSIADCTEAIGLDPDAAKVYAYRGDAYHCKGEYDRSIADYTEAIRLDPNSAWDYGRRANAYLCGSSGGRRRRSGEVPPQNPP